MRTPPAQACRHAVAALIGLGIAAGFVPASRGAPRDARLPGKWLEVTTPHFVVLSNAGRRPARETAEHFEQIREIFLQALPGRIKPGPPLQVFAVSGERTMKRMLPHFWDRKDGTRPAGAFRSNPTGAYAVVRADLLMIAGYGTVYHEYFHFLVDSSRAKVPTWLNEGLATYWASTRLTAKAAEVGRPDIDRLDYLRGEHLLPLDELMAADRSSPHYSQSEKAWRFYAQSWALTHYLMIGDRSGKGRQQLIDYLQRIAAGTENLDAARQAFGDLEDLETRLRAYVRKLLFPYAKLAPPAKLEDGKIQVRDVSPGEAAARVALYRLEDRTTRGVPELVATALEDAPELAATQAASGLLHALNRDYRQAELALERAVRIDGASALAHYAYAVVRLRRGRAPEDLTVVEQQLLNAIAKGTRLAPARARLAEVYRRLDGCSRRALPHIRGARIMWPHYPLYRLKEAQILLECGDAEYARAIARQAVAEVVESEYGSLNNEVCWNGSLWGLAAEALPACDQAVALRPESYSWLDSRAVARAVVGDVEGAIADFRAALELAGDRWDAEMRAKRGAWLRALEAGSNPFVGDALAEFRDDPQEIGLKWWL